MSVLLQRVFVALIALGAGGCSSMFKEPPGITYAESVLQLGITPVYPPREDIQVGDVYAVEYHAADERLEARSAFVGHRNLLAEVNEYLGSRYDLSPKGILGDGLPINGFPEITVNSGVSLGLGGQPQGLMASLGLSYTRTLMMNLKFSNVVAYEVPIPDGMIELDAYCSNNARCRPDLLVNFINQRFQLGEQDNDRVRKAGVMMITKVYLAKTITYTFNDAQLAAAAVALQEEGKTQAEPPLVTQEDMAAAVSQDNAQLVKALSDAREKSLASAKAGGSPTFQISVVQGEKVAFSETFDRPLVVGYEAVSR
jgi:hypothetical protein